MAQFHLTDPRLADIISGRVPWPTPEELAAMPKLPDGPPDVLSGPTFAGPVSPTDGTTETLEDGRVIQSTKDSPAATTVEMYTPEADVTETDDKGVVTLLAAGGVPIPRAEAEQRGLIKARHAHGPQETK